MTHKTLTVVTLPGLHLDTLGHYFCALGLLRFSAQKWAQVKSCWRNGTFCLVGGPSDFAELEAFLLERGAGRHWTPYAKSWDAFQKKDTATQGAEYSAPWVAVSFF